MEITEPIQVYFTEDGGRGDRNIKGSDRSETFVKPIFHLATLFARREAKTRIRQRDWLKLAGEKIRREQVGSVPTFLCVRANKFARWKIDFIVPIL